VAEFRVAGIARGSGGVLGTLVRGCVSSLLFCNPSLAHGRRPCSNLCAIHAKRVTIMPKDIHLARRIRGPWGGLA
jgi:hypothetical protein